MRSASKSTRIALKGTRLIDLLCILEGVDVYFYELFYADEYGTHITFFFFFLSPLALISSLCTKEPLAIVSSSFLVHWRHFLP